jgi:hypothetical protein
MLTTYKAKLHGSAVHWIDERPLPDITDQDVDVLITVLTDIHQSVNRGIKHGEQMAQYLEKIAQTGGIAGITDPVTWQRELRQNRHLLDEEDDHVD